MSKRRKAADKSTGAPAPRKGIGSGNPQVEEPEAVPSRSSGRKRKQVRVLSGFL